ncbi:unnamed protein product [Brassicogethes aeneus]|uniref:Uncharacterized protein n=1 Tax=Brassicogethes aeneus TaxID=1431903 RepID=A0A9P0B395_BRAAE|nr:unnamed protein product [Brassicogethes aeneus]
MVVVAETIASRDVEDIIEHINPVEKQWHHETPDDSGNKDNEDEEGNKEKPPPDTFLIVHALFFFLGLMHFIPNTFFSVATQYFLYKFRNTSLGEDWNNATLRNTMQKEFGVYSTIFGSTPLIIFMTLTTVYGQRINVRTRISWSVAFMLMAFAVSTVFISVDTDDWQLYFYILTMFLIALKSAANSVLGVSLFEVLTKFPRKYMVWYLTGEGIAGPFNSILQIISLAIGTDIKSSALIYFLCGVFVMSITLLLFTLTRFSKLYLYYIGKSDTVARRKFLSWPETKFIISKIWSSIFIFLIMISGLQFISPAVTSLVVSQDQQTPWGTTYFLPFTFLLRDTCDLIGRTLASKIPIHMNQFVISILGVVRVSVLIPLYMFSNAQPRERLPVIFPYDYQYCLIVTAYGLSGGYLFNVAYLNVTRLVEKEKSNDAYNVLTTCVGIIGAISSAFSYISVNFL